MRIQIGGKWLVAIESMRTERSFAALIAGFGLLALAVAVVGITSTEFVRYFMFVRTDKGLQHQTFGEPQQ